jgi:hypothetical protein
MQSRKTKKKKEEADPRKKKMQEWRRGEEREGGRGYLSCGITWAAKPYEMAIKNFLKFSGPLSRTSAELGLVAPFLHTYWVKSCFRPNSLCLIGWIRCLAVFGLVGAFFISFFYCFNIFQYSILN